MLYCVLKKWGFSCLTGFNRHIRRYGRGSSCEHTNINLPDTSSLDIAWLSGRVPTSEEALCTMKLATKQHKSILREKIMSFSGYNFASGRSVMWLTNRRPGLSNRKKVLSCWGFGVGWSTFYYRHP
jgi:hypothetical protein